MIDRRQVQNLILIFLLGLMASLWAQPSKTNQAETIPSRQRAPERVVKIAVLQAGTNHSLNGNPGPTANFNVLAEQARLAAEKAPDLIVFPEYAISGWKYPPEEAMNGLAESIPGPGYWFQKYVALASEIQIPMVGWLVEKEPEKLFNTAFLLNEGGDFIGKYRKVHANLGEQTWWGWSQGDSFQPIEHKGVRYGISICADMFFPETVLCEELLGADVIVHLSISDDMGQIVPVRAMDSEIPIVVSISRGGSYAVDARGQVLGKLPAAAPGWMIFELQPFLVQTQQKYGGLWIPELGRKNLRNVRAYQILIDPATRPPWTKIFLDNQGNPQTKQQLLQRFKGRYDARDPENP